MDFAANAVADVIAPPARTPNARPANADGGRSFDEHLDRAAIEDAPEQPCTEAAPSSTQATPEQPTETSADAAPPSEPPSEPATSTETPTPVFVVQIVQLNQPQASPTAGSDQPAASAATAPLQPAQPANVNAGDAAPVNGAKNNAVGGEGKTDQPHQAQPNTPASPQPPAPPQTANAPAAPPPAASASTPEAAPIESIAAMAQPTPAPVTREAPQPRPAKLDPSASKTDGEATTKADSPQAPHAKLAPPASQSATPQNTDAKPAGATLGQAQAPQNADASAAQANAVMQASTTTTHASQATSHVEHAARAAPASAQVAREIVRQFDGENTRFELRLDPPELGRVEIRLEVSRDNRVTAVVAADNPQALAELARHARDLEQMLQSSGLELTENGLSFDLRQGGDSDADAGDGASNNARGSDAETDTPNTQTSARPLGFERWRGVRVDIMA